MNITYYQNGEEIVDVVLNRPLYEINTHLDLHTNQILQLQTNLSTLDFETQQELDLHATQISQLQTDVQTLQTDVQTLEDAVDGISGIGDGAVVELNLTPADDIATVISDSNVGRILLGGADVHINLAAGDYNLSKNIEFIGIIAARDEAEDGTTQAGKLIVSGAGIGLTNILPGDFSIVLRNSSVHFEDLTVDYENGMTATANAFNVHNNSYLNLFNTEITNMNNEESYVMNVHDFSKVYVSGGCEISAISRVLYAHGNSKVTIDVLATPITTHSNHTIEATIFNVHVNSELTIAEGNVIDCGDSCGGVLASHNSTIIAKNTTIQNFAYSGAIAENNSTLDLTNAILIGTTNNLLTASFDGLPYKAVRARFNSTLIAAGASISNAYIAVVAQHQSYAYLYLTTITNSAQAAMECERNSFIYHSGTVQISDIPATGGNQIYISRYGSTIESNDATLISPTINSYSHQVGTATTGTLLINNATLSGSLWVIDGANYYSRVDQSNNSYADLDGSPIWSSLGIMDGVSSDGNGTVTNGGQQYYGNI